MTAMDRDLWARVEPRLEEAMELALEERGPWLARLRETAPELAPIVEALLEQESGPRAAWLEGDLIRLFGDRPGLAGQPIGHYTLESPIGHGGMGSVWLASRSDGRFQGKVAIKLLNLALVGRAAEQRFVQEGTVLARLNHPNIARLLDAGVTDGGQPYLVLEYVHGQRLDQYVEAHRLGPEARITLFRKVLEAVGVAHANLVVHRDLKPSNVMVTADGTVKLLDFGIAKLLDQGRAAGPRTETEGRPFTPEFAAPEAITGEPITTATDIYSLGVMLYQLLSGRHPAGTVANTPTAHLDAVLRGDPIPRLGLGDLDTVLAKALRPRSEHRYQTAVELDADLGHYLAHEPVSARPDSWLYRAGRFARRHRIPLAATGLVIASLAALTGYALHQQRLALRERDRARSAARRSAASVSFETTLFRMLDQGGKTFTYQELLDRARDAVEHEYQADPVARMEIAVQFAQIYLRRGDPKSAGEVLTHAVAIADSAGDREWQARTRCELIAAAGGAGQRDSAVRLMQVADSMLARVPEADGGTLEACDANGGRALIAAGHPDSALLRYRRVADRYLQAGDTLSEAYLYALNDVAWALSTGHRPHEAVVVLTRALAMTRGGHYSDYATPTALVANIEAANTDLGEDRANLALLSSILADSTGVDSIVARQPSLRLRFAALLVRLGQPDSARSWVDRMLAHEEERSPYWAWFAHVTGAKAAIARHDSAELARHVAAATKLARTLGGGAWNQLGLIRILTATGTPAAIRAEIRHVLDTLGYRPGAPGNLRLSSQVLAAAERLNDLRFFADAKPYAEAAAALYALDSLTVHRSGRVGAALLQQARAEAGLGDTTAARVTVARALPPLRNGLGDGHPYSVTAAALRDSLGR